MRLWGFWCLNMANWVRYPLPLFSAFPPLESMRSGGAIPPPQKGYLSDTCAMPYENRANGCDTPLCDAISKGHCAIWGGISHWAARPGKIVCRLLSGIGPEGAGKLKENAYLPSATVTANTVGEGDYPPDATEQTSVKNNVFH